MTSARCCSISLASARPEGGYRDHVVSAASTAGQRQHAACHEVPEARLPATAGGRLLYNTMMDREEHDPATVQVRAITASIAFIVRPHAGSFAMAQEPAPGRAAGGLSPCGYSSRTADGRPRRWDRIRTATRPDPWSAGRRGSAGRDRSIPAGAEIRRPRAIVDLARTVSTRPPRHDHPPRWRRPRGQANRMVPGFSPLLPHRAPGLPDE